MLVLVGRFFITNIEVDLHASRSVLDACSEKFQLLLEGEAKNTLFVNYFSREDMSLFLKFATVFAFPGESKNQFDLTLSRESIVRIMPIVSYYGCDGLWISLISYIEGAPDLLLLVEAEKCAHKSIGWNEQVLCQVIDEILTKPKNSETVEIKRGFLRHQERGSLETGILIRGEKVEPLNKLTSPTMTRLMQLMVKTKTNAHVVDSPTAKQQKERAIKKPRATK